VGGSLCQLSYPEQFKTLYGPFTGGIPVNTPYPQALGHIVKNGCVEEQRLLKKHGDPSPESGLTRAGNLFSIEGYGAALSGNQTGERQEQA